MLRSRPVRHGAFVAWRITDECKLCSGYASFRRCKGLRLIVPGEQRGFYKSTAPGQNKNSFSNFTTLSMDEIARKNSDRCKISRQTEAKPLRPELLHPDTVKAPPNSWQDG